ncbi:hypothetical protein AGMMS49546_34440 [Spirochaetia bacterium]|nr:hypothetical protein AGMMS49546_34440 [Spirochaetia bacterium]
MEIKYTYRHGEQFLIGYLDEYPEYPTQGEDLQDLELNLLDIYEMIQDGTLQKKSHGVLQLTEAV